MTQQTFLVGMFRQSRLVAPLSSVETEPEQAAEDIADKLADLGTLPDQFTPGAGYVIAWIPKT